MTQVDRVSLALRRPCRHTAQGLDIGLGLRGVVLGSPLVHGRNCESAVQRLRLEIANPVQAFRALAMFKTAAKLQVVWVGVHAFTKHDVDGACNGTCTGFSCGRTHDFNFFNHLGGQ